MGDKGFKEAGLYSFYSQKSSVALFGGIGRKSQYQILHYEDSIHSKDITLIKSRHFIGAQKLNTRMGNTIYFKNIQNFQCVDELKFEIESINKSMKQVLVKIANN